MHIMINCDFKSDRSVEHCHQLKSTMLCAYPQRVANVGSRIGSRLAGNAALCAMAAEKYTSGGCGESVQLDNRRLFVFI
jgi:hypothetical protein